MTRSLPRSWAPLLLGLLSTQCALQRLYQSEDYNNASAVGGNAGDGDGDTGDGDTGDGDTGDGDTGDGDTGDGDTGDGDGDGDTGDGDTGDGDTGDGDAGDGDGTTEAGGSPGTGGSGTGGSSGSGGDPGTGGDPNTGGTGPTCVIGATKGSEVAVIGDAFIAASTIVAEIQSRARSQGSLGASENYFDESVSGTTLVSGQIPNQYQQAVQSSSETIRYVLMNAGGTDCLNAGDASATLEATVALFDTMASSGTEKILFFFLPDPFGSQWASLAACLDTLRPQIQSACEGLTSAQCYFLDLRDTWSGHSEYSNDGVLPSTAGSVATADVVWDSMVDNCIAQ